MGKTRSSHLHLVSVPHDQIVLISSQLRRDPAVKFVEPNHVYSVIQIPNDSLFSSLWGLHNTGQTGGTIDADMDTPEAWDITTGNSDIIVGIIDTGVDYNHPDLRSKMWRNPNEVAGNNIDDDGNGYVDDIYGINAITNSGNPFDDHGHGSHVSGTIGASQNGIGVVGVSWGARIAACKFLSSSGGGYASDAVKCFNYFNRLKEDKGQNTMAAKVGWIC